VTRSNRHLSPSGWGWWPCSPSLRLFWCCRHRHCPSWGLACWSWSSAWSFVVRTSTGCGRCSAFQVLIGLFGIAVALGALGRAWSGPEALLSHLDPVGTAIVAAGASVVFNNLPAAALLASRVPPHPFALLVGLDIGPNLFVTGSLAWILWWRTARLSGSKPPVGRAMVIGLVAVPLAMAAALAILAVTNSL
jgi:hypothetical protein